MSTLKQTTETHPHLPSGKWEGFYTYQLGPDSEKHNMRFHLTFKDGDITGKGADDVGHFTWKGDYNLEGMTATIIKAYPTHEVNYQGWIDENGIWGNWNIHAFKGGFHIWPKASFQAKEQKEEELARAKRKEAYRKSLLGLKKYIGGRKDSGIDDDVPQ